MTATDIRHARLVNAVAVLFVSTLIGFNVATGQTLTALALCFPLALDLWLWRCLTRAVVAEMMRRAKEQDRINQAWGQQVRHPSRQN